MNTTSKRETTRAAEGEMLGIGETARRFGVSVDTVRRWEARGLISSVRTLGGQRRFRAEDVEQLKASA